MSFLYIVTVHFEHKTTSEVTISRFCMVADNHEEINSRLAYAVDYSGYKTVRIVDVQKIKNKTHLLNTRTVQKEGRGEHIKQNDGTVPVHQDNAFKENKEYHPRIYAIGIATTVIASDEKHAFRKVGSYLHASNTAGGEAVESPLSIGSVVTIEEVAMKSGYASPRDVSNEANLAHFVRG